MLCNNLVYFIIIKIFNVIDLFLKLPLTSEFSLS